MERPSSTLWERESGWYPPAVAMAAFLAIVAIAGAEGGYFPTVWNWATLVFAWLLGVAAVLRGRPTLGRLEIATVASLALLTALTALSVAWSDDRPGTVLEIQRTLLYLVALLAILLGVRRQAVSHLLGGLLAGITAIAAYALTTRLFPARGDGLDEIVLNRLAEPIGYWNALGVFAAMGALLALGFAARGRTAAIRAAAAAGLPLLLTTVYFTYSRGAWLALAAGVAAAIALDRRRLQLMAVALVVVPASVAAVWISSESEGLTALEAPYEVIAREGRGLALVLVALAAASAAIGLGLALAESRVRVPRAARAGFALALVALAAAALVGVLVRFGGPVQLADDALESFRDEPAVQDAARPAEAESLNQRLFTLRSNGRLEYWDAALEINRADPVVGAGAGTFEQHWLEERPFPSQVRDAHSLYAEALAELGWLGLGLVAVTLAIPLVAAGTARRRRLGGVAAGAYAVYVVHAGVDWDWEVPAVTLTALALAASLLIAGRHGVAVRSMPPVARFGTAAAALVAAAFSVVALVGNQAISSATGAAATGRWTEANEQARTAIRWAPWSAAGWQALGNAQRGLGYPDEARASLLEATRLSPGDWRLWYDLGSASSGAQREDAYARAAELNPFAADIQVLRDRGVPLPPAPKPSR